MVVPGIRRDRTYGIVIRYKVLARNVVELNHTRSYTSVSSSQVPTVVPATRIHRTPGMSKHDGKIGSQPGKSRYRRKGGSKIRSSLVG